MPGCGNCNLYERDLYHAFALAWEKVIADRYQLMPEWQRKMGEGNALEALRARQMMELTSEHQPTKSLKSELVNKVLDHLLVNRDGSFEVKFLDGRKTKVPAIIDNCRG